MPPSKALGREVSVEVGAAAIELAEEDSVLLVVVAFTELELSDGRS